MAKEDFCFTYYDGDAARDKAHMSRLERGAYDDIISAQRKFGALTKDVIKKVLGKDFDECWFALELILKVDAEKYFIEWVKKSIEKSKAHSKNQSENGKMGGRPKSQTKPKQKPNETQTISQKKPLEDGYGNENIEKGVPGGKTISPVAPLTPIDPAFEDQEELSATFVVPDMLEIFCETNKTYLKEPERDYPELLKIANTLNGRTIGANDMVMNEALFKKWRKMCVFIASHNFFKNYSLGQINRHIQAIDSELKNPKQQANGNFQNTAQGSAKNHGKSAGAIKLAHGLAKEIGITPT